MLLEGIPDAECRGSLTCMTESDAIGAILFIYWIFAGLWIFFIKDQED